MRESKVDLLIVRGSPGVGKTTVTHKLRQVFPRGATIEVDALRGMLHGVNWQDPHEHTLALDGAIAWATQLLAAGRRPVVLVDTLSRPRMQKLLPGLPMSFRIASLYARPEVLRDRVDRRPDGHFKDVAACLVLNAEAKGNRYPHDRLFDTSELSAGEVVEQIAQWLAEPEPSEDA